MNQRIELGRVSDFSSLPAALELAGHNYLLTRNADDFKLFSSVCPHQGGMVHIEGSDFVCPQHG